SAFQKALQWYQNRQYQVARGLFSAVKSKTDDIDTEADCAYYMAGCAIRLNEFGADALMEDFVKQYPESSRRNTAFATTGDYYFENGKYQEALKWYTMAEEKNMLPQNPETFNFRKGYTLFHARKYGDARPYMEKVEHSKKYAPEAAYYLGYIAYNANDYEKANTYFSTISEDKKLNTKLSYYQADMNFKLGNFQKAIDFGTKQLATADRQELSQLNKIIGESYFNLKQYKEALPYLKAYQGERGRWSHTDFYQLGYAYYKQEDYENAIGQFNKIINGKDAIAQNAYYHLAECYLKTDKKQEALNAFKNASQMEFNAQIRQDAWLNYARLSYDIGNPYQSVPEVLNAYLANYPDSGYTEEIKALLLDAYITAKKYDAALAFLQNEKTYDSDQTYQKVAFRHGLELIGERNYREAITYLEKSLTQPHDALINTRAAFWIAEAQYMLDNYDEAVIGFKDFAQRDNATQTPE
ncbi:MAG: tetratricopeptide repeat protein, partial [Sinomicrobium sp.]|nr:tetratricopeptide repeat protein [Sinomicrobium sp.]